ncbi:MAG: transcriptional regulator [Ignavibacteria bacterium]|nr:transcriptional regulator [Ignavibacteria bacterium]
MPEFDYQAIDELIHSRIRTAIMAVLISVERADFNFIKEKVNTTDGNLSVHLKKLEDAGYLEISKEFIDRKPKTNCRITEKGTRAFDAYIRHLESLLMK